MSLIKTQAVKITESNYPIAMACLPPGFATLPLYSVVGTWLVINELDTVIDTKQKTTYLVVGNSWMKESLFTETYSFVSDPDPATGFSQVLRTY